MNIFKNRAEKSGEPDFTKLPRHIAIIMDGNGRWAKKRGLPRNAGHAAGAETFRRVATYCKNIGIEYLTVYAFSTENWKRPKDEVDAIMALLEKYITEAIEKMERDRVKMKFFGDTSVLSEKLQTLIAETEEISKRFDGVQVNICLNYGGRDEIIRAAQACAEDFREKGTEITEESFGRHMYSAGIPDPDLVIRPSGEERLSNFLLWQAAYAELYFTPILWPDFDEKELDRAITAYQRRSRRYGGI
ncbi:MAG: isoprenyl transferase [Oscillospiraceae bacterium]